MMNLLQETQEMLKRHDKTLDDVIWIGDKNKKIAVDDFIKMADREYDNGYGIAEVNEDLLIVGKNWWLERLVYDGKESWDYKTTPQQPDDYGLNIWYEWSGKGEEYFGF